MADFAPNYTARYRVRYFVGGANHSTTLRCTPGSQTNAAISAIGAAVYSDVFTALGGSMSDDLAILGADVAVKDSDIFLPAEVLPVGAGSLGADLDAGFRPINLSFVGRSSSGGRAVFRIFGVGVNPMAASADENDYRLTIAESLPVMGVVNALNLATVLCANDGAPVTWYPYANININSYWQKRNRRG
jgi:hypothetical protein